MRSAREASALLVIRGHSMSSLLDLSRRLLALSQTGLHFTHEEYDRERYREMAQIAGEMLALESSMIADQLRAAWLVEDGYATPKVDVRGAVFRGDQVLMVKERVDRLKKDQQEFTRVLKRNSFQLNNVVVSDLREAEGGLPKGNRFLIYTLFPDSNVSLRVHWGPAHHSVIAAVGHSIFNRTCKTSVGDLMSKYGGGGHRGAGTCVLPLEKAADAIDEILFELQANG